MRLEMWFYFTIILFYFFYFTQTLQQQKAKNTTKAIIKGEERPKLRLTSERMSHQE